MAAKTKPAEPKNPDAELGDERNSGRLKQLGGAEDDRWNNRITDRLLSALPIDQRNSEAWKEAMPLTVGGLVYWPQ